MSAASLGMPVEIGRIDKELGKLWESTDDSKTRASLINLAIYTENEAAASQNTDLISKIATEHACRALLILANPESTESPRAGVDQRALPRCGQTPDLLRADHLSARWRSRPRSAERRVLAPRFRPATVLLVAGRISRTARREDLGVGRPPPSTTARSGRTPPRSSRSPTASPRSPKHAPCSAT